MAIVQNIEFAVKQWRKRGPNRLNPVVERGSKLAIEVIEPDYERGDIVVLPGLDHNGVRRHGLIENVTGGHVKARLYYRMAHGSQVHWVLTEQRGFYSKSEIAHVQ